MDQQTYNQKISELKNSGEADAPGRIAYLEKFYQTQQAEAAERDEKERREAEAYFKESLRQAYMQAPNATEAEFEREYPKMRADILRNKALNADQAARAAMLSGYRTF